MQVTATRFSDVLLIEPDVFGDERGFFFEAFNRPRLVEFGISTDFLQDNHSRSVRDTVRGLHYQAGTGQVKLVRAARGRIWDVVVDIRRDSPSFGLWEAFELDDVAHRQLYVPVGFAHGFCALSEVADVCYKVSSLYDPSLERGVAWNDPQLDISWPSAHPRLSERDRHNPSLADLIE